MGFLINIFEFIANIALAMLTLGAGLMSWLFWFDMGEEFGEEWGSSIAMIAFPCIFLYLIYSWLETLVL